MVVDQVHIHGVSSVETPDNPPVGADSDSPETSQITFQWVQAKTGQVHFFRPIGTIQNGKDVLDFVEYIRPYLGRVAALKKPLQTTMPEALYHSRV